MSVNGCSFRPFGSHRRPCRGSVMDWLPARCICLSVMVGPRCDRPANCSALQHCNGHGVCVADGVCQCLTQYSGPSCDIFSCAKQVSFRHARTAVG